MLHGPKKPTRLVRTGRQYNPIPNMQARSAKRLCLPYNDESPMQHACYLPGIVPDCAIAAFCS